MKVAVGIHVLGTLKDCPKELLSKVESVKPLIIEAAKRAKFKVVGEQFHQFAPYGVTGILLLSESHMSIHTWPEKNMAAVDIFTCGDEGNAEEGFEIVKELFNARRVDKNVVKR